MDPAGIGWIDWMDSSSFAVYIAYFDITMQSKLSHYTSSTAAEIAGVREALSFMVNESPQS